MYVEIEVLLYVPKAYTNKLLTKKFYYYYFLNLLTTVVSPGEPPHHFSSLSRQRPDEKSDENSRCQGFLSIFLEQLFPSFPIHHGRFHLHGSRHASIAHGQ